MMYIKIIPDTLVLCGDICKRVIKFPVLTIPFWVSQDCFVHSSCTHLLFHPDLTM